MKLFLWDVKYKTWLYKWGKLNLTLCEFNQGSFGLGFDWYYNKSPITTRYGRYACLTVRFMWVEILASAEWGPQKARYDKMIQDLRSKNDTSTSSS